MKKIKRISAILLTLTFILAFCSACVGDGGNSAVSGNGTNANNSAGGVLSPGEVVQPPEGEDVRFADLIDIIPELPVSVIDPLNPGAAFAAVLLIYGCIFDRLIERTDDGDFVPGLASSWETGDMQTYTFNLRDDVYFHNGDKFTAQDVIDTFMLIREAPGTQAFDLWRNVDSVTAIDEHTVRIVLNAVNADFLYGLSLPGAGFVLNKAAREADPISGAWVGTGAFYVSDFASSEHTMLTRNEDYWGIAPLTKQLYLHFVPEIAARALMLLNGESDVCGGIGTEDLDMFVADPNFTVYRIIANSVHNLAFSMIDPITGDLNFRKAVAYALDRNEICTVAVGDWGLPVTDGAIWGDTTPFRNTGIPLLPYDLDLARQYLDASAYNGEEIEIVCADGALLLSAQMIQEQLGRIGIDIKVSLLDPLTLMSRSMYGSDQVQIVHFVSPFDLSASSARGIFYAGAGANRASYNNPAVNELLDLVPTIADPEERGEIYRQIQEIVAEDMPYINLYYRMQSVVASSDVGGIIVNADMYYDFRSIFKVLDD